MTARLSLLLVLALCWAAQARAEYFKITHYTIQVTLDEKGEADVEEVIEVQFSEPRHGIFRFIPYENVIDGKEIHLLIDDIQVEGFKFSTSKQGTNIVTKIGDADVFVEGRQVYRLRYHVINPLQFFDEHSQLYWDLLGINWPVEIEKFSFTLQLPPQVSIGQGDVYHYSGAAGSTTSTMDVQVSPRWIEGKSTQLIHPNEGFTLAVRFPKGTFQAMDEWAYFKKRHGLLFAPVFFIFGGLLAKWMARNKQQTIMTEYFPPEGVSPAIAGGFVDHSVDNNDVLCLIPHLAQLGYLRMDVEEGGFLQKDQITFYKLKNAGPELFEFEKSFFNALFATGSQVQLRDLKDRFYMHMSSIKSLVKDWIHQQGWYETDQKAMGCVTGILGLVALGWGAYAAFVRQNSDGFVLIVTGFFLFFLATRFNKRTTVGNESYRKFEGFRQFVKRAERPVIERLLKEDPHYYDKTMAYALAFGYLKQWNKQFEGLLTEPPAWYGGHGMHGAALHNSWNDFSTSFPSEVNSIGSVFSSSPGSSSSGGGGGGSSGGGGGGGGGGSW